MFSVQEVRFLGIEEAEGTFLVRTRSGAWYTLLCTRRADRFVLVSGGSCNRPAEELRIEGDMVAVGRQMYFNEGYEGHSMPVRDILDVTGVDSATIDALKQTYP